MATERVWSAKQEAIFLAVLNSPRNLVVRARAGCGKTTTITEAVKRLLAAQPERVIIVAAFGKAIQQELEKRFVGYNVTVKTLHSIGLSCVKRFWPDVKVSFSTDRENELAERVCGRTAPDDVKKLVAKLCTKGREIAPHAAKLGDLTDIAIRFECEPSDDWALDGFGLDYVELKALEAMQLAAAEKPVRTGIDGADMLFLPVRNGWLRKMCDDIFVDEAQDMNPVQLEIAIGIARKRAIVIGDDRQGIYGFRGADSGALDRLKRELNAEELSLNTTYRCGKAIVACAARIVPDFEAGPDNHEGDVHSMPLDKLVQTAQQSDFILSRTNAPLVSIAMSLLANGKRARIAGRDIGKGLVTLIRKMKARSVPELLTKIENWKSKELRRLEARFADRLQTPTFAARRDAIIDQADMLCTLCGSAASVNDVEANVNNLFTDDGLGSAGVITCSSVHRSKGLEAPRVFVLATTLRDDNEEERNIAYVAQTRAINELVFVS